MNFGMFTDFHVRQNMSQAEAFDESFRQNLISMPPKTDSSPFQPLQRCR